MRKRKGGSETLIPKAEEGGDETRKEEKGLFFACYLLGSLSPRHKGHSYIGFTVNPRRRIRQHNGQMRSGAWRTKTKRPWEMILCIYGFPTNVSALQFEWAWQHPTESLAVRKAAASLKSLSGIANKIKLAYTMLTLPAWQSLNLTVNFFSTKYKKHSAGCPSLPEHMKVQICLMDELPCYSEHDQSSYENEDDWHDEEECNKTGSTDGSLKEGLRDITVHNSADNQNSIEKTIHERFGWIEENSMKQPRDSPILREDHRQPFSLINSPVRTLSSIATNCFSRVETFEDRDLFGLTEESSYELDPPTRKQLLADKDQPPINSLTASHEVEVIDVLTPSPDCRISSRIKKRRVSTVRPEIIDLTKSPIFVQL